jgi:hypothetical protein
MSTEDYQNFLTEGVAAYTFFTPSPWPQPQNPIISTKKKKSFHNFPINFFFILKKNPKPKILGVQNLTMQLKRAKRGGKAGLIYWRNFT